MALAVISKLEVIIGWNPSHRRIEGIPQGESITKVPVRQSSPAAGLLFYLRETSRTPQPYHIFANSSTLIKCGVQRLASQALGEAAAIAKGLSPLQLGIEAPMNSAEQTQEAGGDQGAS